MIPKQTNNGVTQITKKAFSQKGQVGQFHVFEKEL